MGVHLSKSKKVPMDHLVHWWRVVRTPRARDHVAVAGETLPTLILIATSADDVANLKADLPALEFWNAPPAPASPSIVYGAFTLNDDSIGSLFTLWQKSKLLRVAVIGEQDATTAALFAGQLKDPLSVVIVKGWPAGSGQALTRRLENVRRSTIPTAFAAWCSLTPHASALVLCGEDTRHLALQVPRACLKYRQMTLKTVANMMERWFWEMKDASVLFVETSFDESLSPALYGSGLQGVLRALVLDVRRTYDIVILTPSGDEQKFERLNHPRDQGWLTLILPSDCSASHTTVAASCAAQRPQSKTEHSFAQHPLMRDFRLGAQQKAMVYQRPLFHEDKVALHAHMEKMRRRAAFGR
jgi:hypothetical protein